MKKPAPIFLLSGVFVLGMPLLATNGFAKQNMPEFTEIDKNQDGQLTRSEYEQAMSAATGTGEGKQQTSQLEDKQVKAIEGKTVIDSQGKKLGEIEQVTFNQEKNQVFAVVSVGGFMGMGAEKAAIPLKELQLQGQQLKWKNSMSEDKLAQQYPYSEQQHRKLNDKMQLSVAQEGVFEETQQGQKTSQKSGQQTGMTQSFEELDKNEDGVLSKEEAQQVKQLTQNWEQADRNQNGQLEKSEFSAFETQSQKQQKNQ